MGIALFVIFTVVDVFFLSIPMYVYIMALMTGSGLIMSVFNDDMPFIMLPDRSKKRK
jgi:hypothetical protein